ncbi:hypothetical protein [Massilia sp. CT11-137]|uniref:hypothetical protein n=1 Tax=Massilia sp. CT11-137 TaxID=3393901 RepID=UPI0039A558A8
MANLGSLVVTLEANIAKYLSDMKKSGKETEDAMKRVEGAIEIGKKALEVLGVGVTVGAFAELIKGSIDAADELRDMSQKTGVAVQTLNGLGFAAGQAGGNLESVSAAAGKVNKSVAEAAGGNKDMIEAYSKLGISVRDAQGNLKTADVVIAEVADKFKDYADGPEKTAIALRVFGKAGADMIPLLNDGGDALRENIAYAKQYSGVTDELASASDNFNDTMGKLTVQQKGFANSIASAVLPLLQTVADEMLGAAESSNKFSLAGAVVRTVLETFVVVGSEVAFTFKAVGTEIGGIAAQLAALAHGDIKGFNFIGDAMKADAAKAAKEHQEFIDKVLDRTPQPAVAPAPAVADDANKPKPRAPTLRAKGDDPTRALLEGQIKAIEAAYAQERDTAAFQDQFMQELRAQDIVDVQTYAQYKIAAIEQARDASVRAYDAEISALQKAQAVAGKDADKAAIANKIAEKVALRDKARLDATRALEMQTLSMSAAQSGLNKSMEDWNREQDQAESQLRFNNDLYGKSALEVAKLTDARRLELDIEEKIRQAKEKGTITEASIAQYRKDAADHAAKINSATTQSIGRQTIDSLKTPQEQENAQYANHLKDLQSYRDKELANTIEADQAIEREKQRHAAAIAEMEAANYQQSLSMAGGAADQLYGLLQQSGREQSALAKAAFLASKAIAVAEIILNTEVAAAKAGAQLGVFGLPMATVIRVSGYASAGMVAGMAIAGAREKGGPVWDGGAFLVGEKGPEIFRPPTHGTIIPNDKIGGGGGDMKLTIVNNTRAPIGNVTEHRISATERALIIEEAVSATASSLADPNSRTSRAMNRNYSVPRSRS